MEDLQSLQFRKWPISEVAARLVEVRSVERSGLDLLTGRRSSHSHRPVTRDVRRGRAGARAHLSLRTKPRSATLALDHVGQRNRDRLVARRFGAVLLVRRQLWQVQRDLRLARRRDRLHDVVVDLRDRDPARCGARCRDGAPNRGDTTTGSEKPLGARGARMADTVGAARSA